MPEERQQRQQQLLLQQQLQQQLQQLEEQRQLLQLQKREHFTPKEDEILQKLVERSGTNIDWSAIASKIPGRTARQCRERFERFVNPEINRNPWTPEEDELLRQKQNELGNKWALISKFLPGRTDMNIKNRYNQLQRQKLRQPKQPEPQPPLPSLKDTLKNIGMAIEKIDEIINVDILSISK